MNGPFDPLRSGLADLAEEVIPVDLLDRALATSRRLRLRRTLAGSAAVVATIAVASGVALAMQPGPGPEPDPMVTPPGPTVTGSPRPDPTVSPRPSPTPTAPESPATATAAPPVTSPDIPRSAMLRASDVGPEYAASDDIRPGDHGSLFFLLSYCGYQSQTWTAKDDRVLGRRGRGLNDGEQRYVLQEATRYQPGWAARVIAELRTALRSCRTVAIGGNPDDTSTLTVAAAGFAGDGSLLVKDVRSTPDGASTQYHVAVRQGDVYAHARIHIDGMTEQAALGIGRRAAQRLCSATPTC